METRRKREHRNLEGMTLIEIMIVVVIMALIATAAGVGVMKAKASVDIDLAKSGVRAVASVAETYMIKNRGTCPTLEELKSGNYFSRGASTEDPWGAEYVLACEQGDLSVRSAGPDKQLSTEDDITL
jgi:general secretion pathway protein G